MKKLARKYNRLGKPPLDARDYVNMLNSGKIKNTK